MTFSQKQELEEILTEFQQNNKIFGTIKITFNNRFLSIEGAKVDGDSREDTAYLRGYAAALKAQNKKKEIGE